MANPKLVLLVLAFVAILFACGVGVGVGARNPDGPINPDDSPVARLLGSILVTKQPLAVDEVKDCTCFGPEIRAFRLPAPGSCAATIAESRAGIRTLSLRLESGTNAIVNVEWAPSNGPTVRVTLKPDRVLELQAPAKGGDLTLKLESAASFPTLVHLE